MQIYIRSLAAVILLAQLLGATAVKASNEQSRPGAPQSPGPQIRESALSKTPIEAGGLKITITKFEAHLLQVVVENTSSSFVTFHPDRLEFVGSKGNQVSILSYIAGCNAPDLDLPPGSHINKTIYGLSDIADLPAQLYYDRQLIAEITK